MTQAIMRLGLVGAALYGLAPSISLSQLPPSQSGLTYMFDVRQVTDGTGNLGLDFNLQFTRERTRATPQGIHASFDAGVRGFTTFDAQLPEVNSMQAQIALSGRYYRAGLSAPLPTELQIRMLDLLDRDAAGGGPGLGAAEERELNQLVAENAAKRVFITFDAHYRMEAAQDLDTKQWAAGAGIGAEVPLLGDLLDILADATRDSSGFRAQPVRAYLAIDHVTPGEVESGIPGAVSNDGWRSRIEMAWSTRVLGNFVLRASWEAQYALSEARVSRENRFTNFFQAWIKLPVSTEAGVIVKYLSGQLPPTFKTSDGAALGLSVGVF